MKKFLIFLTINVFFINYLLRLMMIIKQVYNKMIIAINNLFD